MNTITITPFATHQVTKKYQRQPAYEASVDTSERCRSIIDYLECQREQIRNHNGPRGVHFGEWKGSLNDKTNLISNHALVLDYRWGKAEELMAALPRLPYAAVVATTEDKKRTANLVSLIWPFSQPCDAATYERLASVFAKTLDTYGLEDGALSATHVINLHATTLLGFERGALLDPEAHKKMTARMYQELDATKYHALDRPAPKPIRAAPVHLARPTFTAPDDMVTDLFKF